MKYQKKKIFTIFLVFTFFLNLFLAFTVNNCDDLSNPRKDIKKDEDFTSKEVPKISDSSITIKTPENKTYSDPMSGYYPASYGFESDVVGSTPVYDELYYEQTGGSTATVRAERNGHKNVMELYDNIVGGRAILYIDHGPAYYPNGTIELWILTNDVTKGLGLEVLTDDGVGPKFVGCLRIYNTKFQYYDSLDYYADISGASTPQNNVWYHFRIDFEQSDGGYMGLDQYYYYAYINGIRYGPYATFYHNNQRYCQVNTGSAQVGMNGSVDAIGNSWDPNYKVGDNLKEGLLLSYNNNTNLDWMGYSLDGQANKTIRGNTTIPIPDDGAHTIQVFGNDSSGINYQSDERYFSIFTMNIVSPENKTYTGPMSGYYYGTQGFECDKDGALPKGFDVGLPDGSGYVRVESSLAGHNKVCQLRKNGGTQFARLDAFFSENATSGTLEFWIYKDTDSSTDLTGFSIGSATVPGSIVFGIINGDLYQHYWGSHTYFATDVFTKNTWHHIRWDFDLEKGWQLQLDDTWYGSGYAFSIEAGATFIDRFRLGTGFSGVNPNYGTWMDAFSYSWDPDYNVGDNLKEGLLLSYNNNTDLDWMGYSLDGQIRKNILGNTTIPMPSTGTHSIQVLGNDSLGTMHASNIRNFRTGFILLNTPEDKIYTSPMSGYYYGIHGFECDENNVEPEGYIIAQPDGSGYVKVEASKVGHNKVVELRKTGGSIRCYIGTKFCDNTTSGTVELWMYKDTDSSTDITDIYINGATASACVLSIANGDIYQHVWNFPQVLIASNVFTKNVWHHIRLDFDLSRGWQVQLDNTWYGNLGSGYNFPIDNGVTLANNVGIGTGWSGVNPNFGTWIDALGYSWHPDYDTGDNLKEGMLLNFNNLTNLDWMGYSLDNQANKTIHGNTTIPMPTDGAHTIQVFGNNSLGTLYSSELRLFNIDYLSPVVINKIYRISDLGLYIEIELNAVGHIRLSRTETNLADTMLGAKYEAFYFYNISVLDLTFTENKAIVNSIKIRFYYDSNDVKKTENLCILHLIKDIADTIYIWEEIDANALNTGEKYIEVSPSGLSVFCLAEIKIPGNDKEEETTEPSIWLFFVDHMLFIVILSAIGVSAPAVYVIKSRSKKKKAQEATKEFKAKAQKKKAVLEKIKLKTEVSTESKDVVKKSTPVIPIPSLEEAPKKIKKLATIEKTSSKEEQLKQLEEVKKTEKEVNLESNIDICMIHKGKIQGVIYLCPKCSSKYCINCAKTLMGRGEHCWVCDSPFNIDSDAKEPKSKPLKDIIADNKIIIDKLKESNGSDNFNALNNISLTALSEEDWEKIEKIGMEDKDKAEFLKELLSFRPEERSQIIDDMLKRLNNERTIK